MICVRTNRIIKLTGGSVELNNEPLCDAAQLAAFEMIVREKMPAEWAKLPPGHVWQKGAHSEMAPWPYLSEELLKLLGANFNLFRLAFLVHDIGLPNVWLCYKAQPRQWDENFIAKQNHAEESVEVLQRWGALDALPELARDVLVYSITHHADGVSPKLPADATEIQKWQYVFACLLRDIDKYVIYVTLTKGYIGSDDVQKQECHLYSITMDSRIDPEHFIELFTRYLPLPKKEMKTYAAYMLYFLGWWSSDVSLEIIIKAIHQTGAIEMLLGYLKKQIPASQYIRIEEADQAFAKSHNIEIKQVG